MKKRGRGGKPGTTGGRGGQQRCYDARVRRSGAWVAMRCPVNNALTA